MCIDHWVVRGYRSLWPFRRPKVKVKKEMLPGGFDCADESLINTGWGNPTAAPSSGNRRQRQRARLRLRHGLSGLGTPSVKIGCGAVSTRRDRVPFSGFVSVHYFSCAFMHVRLLDYAALRQNHSINRCMQSLRTSLKLKAFLPKLSKFTFVLTFNTRRLHSTYQQI